MDLWTLILSLGALHGLFLAAILGLPRPGRPRAHVYLTFLLLALSIHLGESVAFRLGVSAVDERRFFIFFTTPNTYLFGPLFYLFAGMLLRGGTKRAWLHFVPAVLATVNYLPAYIGVMNGTIQIPAQQPSGPSMFVWINPYLSWAFLITQLSVYVALSYRLLRAFSAGVRQSVSRSNALDADWLWKLAGVMIASLMVQLASLIGMLAFRAHSIEIEYIVWLSFAVAVHFVGWITLRRTQVIAVPLETTQAAPAAAVTAELDAEPKYRRSGLNPEMQHASRAMLLTHMDEARPWLDPDLRLRDLAEAVELSPHHLSQLINQEIGSTFFDFVNGYRVAEAKRRLTDPAAAHLTHLAIALDAGFASKSSFHRVFKKHVGVAPTTYVRSLRDAPAAESRGSA